MAKPNTAKTIVDQYQLETTWIFQVYKDLCKYYLILQQKYLKFCQEVQRFQITPEFNANKCNVKAVVSKLY